MEDVLFPTRKADTRHSGVPTLPRRHRQHRLQHSRRQTHRHSSTRVRHWNQEVAQKTNVAVNQVRKNESADESPRSPHEDVHKQDATLQAEHGNHGARTVTASTSLVPLVFTAKGSDCELT